MSLSYPEHIYYGAAYRKICEAQAAELKKEREDAEKSKFPPIEDDRGKDKDKGEEKKDKKNPFEKKDEPPKDKDEKPESSEGSDPNVKDPKDPKYICPCKTASYLKEAKDNASIEGLAKELKIDVKDAEKEVINFLKAFVLGGLALKEGKSFDEKSVEEGRKVEYEHVDKDNKFGPWIAGRITADHLSENKAYYQKLSEAGL